MNKYANTKKSKKFILVLVLLMMFNICYPKKAYALFGITTDDIIAAPAKIFWWIEEGVLSNLNNMFTNEENHTIEVTNFEEDGTEYSTLDVKLTPENIIKGKFLVFDANIFKEINNNNDYYDYKAGGAVSQGKKVLRDTIAGWYYALRNFAIVALLSVLVYVGIRMIISTVAQDKAKYKVMFKDWLVALCLVVVMHYIMIVILNVTTMITDALGGGANTNITDSLIHDITAILGDDQGGKNNYVYNDMTIGDAYAKILVLGGIILYTFIFAVKYLKREFTIIFLILLGPVSCITYPIDKISDGKAQAFNKWLTEFLYQVIIQPFHLLLYIVLVGSAVNLANANAIYALVCFAVMIPAEKFIKSMFGFKDQLGSPLGAIASTALASKAISALTSKGKGAGGSGGKDYGGDNNSTPNELPPRTVDKPGLVDGNTENNEEDNTGRETIRQQENQNLESGEEPGGSASAADAYQNSDDPVTAAKRAALEEQIADGQLDEDDLTDEQRILLGKEKNEEEDSQEAPEDSEQKDQTSNEEKKEPKTFKEWAKDKVNKLDNTKVMKIHNQRVSKKHASTNRKQRWKRRIAKGAKAGVKGLLKGGAIGLVGTAAMAGALMTGNGKEALGIAAGIGAYAGKKAISGGKKAIKGVKGTAKDYFNAYRDDMSGTIPFVKSREEKALQDFKADRKQQEKALLCYRKNHEGQDPGYADLEKEMEDRFTLSRYGLSDDEIDGVLPIYQEKLEKLEDEGKTPEEAENIAGSQAKQTAKLAKFYKPRDFQDSKAMQNAYNYMFKQLKEETKCEDKVADNYARQYLINAARMHGVSEKAVALPERNQTVDIDIPARQSIPNVTGSLGLESANMTTSQLERMNNITVRLRRGGFNKGEIEKIALNSAGGNVTEVLNKYEANVQYLGNENAQEEARMLIESRNNGRDATSKQVEAEMKERLILKSTFNVNNEKDISAMRDLEVNQLKGKTQVQAAREFAIKNKGHLKDIPHMQKAREDLVEKLKAGGSSRDKARKDAENIINYAQNINGEI